MTLFYGVNQKELATPRQLVVRTSSSCFGSFGGCFNMTSTVEYERRMFFSTSATRDQFNVYAKAMREGLKDGFVFQYEDKQFENKKYHGVVRKFPRPTIGFYERNSTIKGCSPEFAKQLKAGQNYVSFTVPSGVTASEAYSMIKLVLKFLTVPAPTQAHWDSFEEAYKVTGNFFASIMVMGLIGKMGGYSWPCSSQTLMSIQSVINVCRSTQVVFKDYQITSPWAKMSEDRYFADYTKGRDKPTNYAFTADHRHISTAPKAFPNLNTEEVPRGSREAMAFNCPSTVKGYGELLKKLIG